MSALLTALVIAVMVLAVLVGLLARQLRSIRADIKLVDVRSERGFDALNKRISDETLRLKNRLIDVVAGDAQNALWVKELLEELVDRREKRLRAAVDRELIRIEKELGINIDGMEQRVADALTNAHTNLKMALRSEPPPAAFPEGKKVTSREGMLSTVETPDDYDPGDTSVAAPLADPDLPVRVIGLDHDMAYRSIGRCGVVRTWDGSMMRCEKMHPHSGQHQDERGEEWDDTYERTRDLLAGSIARADGTKPWEESADHEFEPSHTGMVCERMVLAEDGSGRPCGLKPEQHPYVDDGLGEQGEL